MLLRDGFIVKNWNKQVVSEMNGSCIKSEHLKKKIFLNSLKSKDINNGMALSIIKNYMQDFR